MLQYVAVGSSVLQCVAVWYVAGSTRAAAGAADSEDGQGGGGGTLAHSCEAVCCSCSVLQCVAVCCSVLQRVAVCCSVLQCVAVCYRLLQCVAVCCSLQCATVFEVCCSVLEMEEEEKAVHLCNAFSVLQRAAVG